MSISAYQRRRYHRKLVMELKATTLFMAFLASALILLELWKP